MPSSSRETSKRGSPAGQFGHADAVFVSGVGDAGFVRRVGGGDEQNAVQVESLGGLRRDRQVGVVNGIEGAAEDRQPHDWAAAYLRSILTEFTRTSFSGRSCAPRGTSEIFFTTS